MNLNTMLNKSHSLWIISILLLTGSILLFIGGPDYYSSRSLKHSWDMGHVLYFALLAILLSRCSLVARMPLVWQWTTILTITFLFGISIEFMQYGTSRTPDIGDVLRDLTGSLLVLVFGPSGSKLLPVKRRLTLQLSVVALSLVLILPFARSLIDEAISWYQFPLLSGFETPFEIDRWGGDDRLSVESITSISDGKLLKLSLTTDKYLGTSLKYFDGDWSSARMLNIRFYNPDKNPLRIVCRIHDLQHNDGHEEYEDRYNNSFLLAPGWNQIEIDLDEVKQSPVGRDMDMTRIRGIGIFAVSLPSPRTLYIDEIRLTY